MDIPAPVEAVRKVPSKYTDVGGALSSAGMSLAFPVLQPINTAGNIAGSLVVLPEEELRKTDPLRRSSAFIPGVGAFRMGTVARGMAERVGRMAGKPHYGLNVAIGPNVANTLLALAGAAVGARIADRYAEKTGYPRLTRTLGAAAGAGLALTPTLLGMLAAWKTPTKSEAQLVREAKRPYSQVLPYIPGYGEYIYMKHLGSGYRKFRGE